MELLNLFKRSDGKPAQDRLIIVGGVNPILKEITETPLYLFGEG